ncbi:MAG: hypothetical protein WCG16_08325 [Methylococcales bacterium]
MTSIHTEKDYARATKIIDMLLNDIGNNEDHPLTDVLEFLADQVKAYEDKHF